MSVFCFNKLMRERAYLAAAMGVPGGLFSEWGWGGPQGQKPPSGTREAGDLY
jgi:hypothetical protein